jgi:hypothetical protein
VCAETTSCGAGRRPISSPVHSRLLRSWLHRLYWPVWPGSICAVGRCVKARAHFGSGVTLTVSAERNWAFPISEIARYQSSAVKPNGCRGGRFSNLHRVALSFGNFGISPSCTCPIPSTLIACDCRPSGEATPHPQLPGKEQLNLNP